VAGLKRATSAQALLCRTRSGRRRHTVTDTMIPRLANPLAARAAPTQLANDNVKIDVLESHQLSILVKEELGPGCEFLHENVDSLVAAGTGTQVDASGRNRLS